MLRDAACVTRIGAGRGDALVVVASGYTLAVPLPSDNGSLFYCTVRSIGLADGSGNASSLICPDILDPQPGQSYVDRDTER